MIRRTLPMALIALGLSACAAIPAGSGELPLDGAYALTRVDGAGVGKRGFTMVLSRDGTYSAAYDCSERFGRYQRNGVLTLELGPVTATRCDAVDLRTGTPVPSQPNFAAQFFADPVFRVSRDRQILILRSQHHTYRFEPLR